MAAPNPRKRAAPGSSPAVQNTQVPQPYPANFPQMSEDNANFLLRSQQGAKSTPYQDPSGGYYGSHDGLSQTPYDQSVSAITPSTQLARRPMSRQQLVSTGQRQAFDVTGTGDPWGQFGDDSAVVENQNPGMEVNDDIGMLEEKATVAKREAQAKRKQIPPFVQKLSRYAVPFARSVQMLTSCPIVFSMALEIPN